MSIAAESLLVSTNAGEGNATDTYGSVGLVQGTCAYIGPLAAGSAGIVTGAAPPLFHPPQVPLHQRHHLLRRHVARDDDRRVLRPIPPLEEHLRIGVLVRHVLDVVDEAHRGVLVRVALIETVALHFEQLLGRVGGVLVVFAENGPRFGLEVGFRIRQVLEDVGVEADDLFEVFLGERRVVRRAIVARARVFAGARLAHDLAVFFGRRVRRATEHQVFEEVREARLAGLDLVARPDLHRNLGC